MIEIKKYTELKEHVRDQLKLYVNNEFGHIPFVSEMEWETPDWTIINYSDGLITSFYNIVERKVYIDGILHKVAGINNVITLPEFRGKGLSTKILSSTESFIFDELKCDPGVLLCADELVPFYNRLNWYKVDCPVYFRQSDGRKLWGANTMLRTKNELVTPGEIDLNGLPW